MLQTIQNKSIDLIDSVVRTLESYEHNEKRERYFADKCIHHPTTETKESDDAYPSLENDGDDVPHESEETLAPKDRFKHLSFELIDIGLHNGVMALDYISQTPIYKATDKYIKYDEKIDVAKEKSI